MLLRLYKVWSLCCDDIVIIVCFVLCFFFFKQKTAYEMRISDWSSDVCSSDLIWTQTAQSSLSRISRSILPLVAFMLLSGPQSAGMATPRSLIRLDMLRKRFRLLWCRQCCS